MLMLISSLEVTMLAWDDGLTELLRRAPSCNFSSNLMLIEVNGNQQPLALKSKLLQAETEKLRKGSKIIRCQEEAKTWRGGLQMLVQATHQKHLLEGKCIRCQPNDINSWSFACESSFPQKNPSIFDPTMQITIKWSSEANFPQEVKSKNCKCSPLSFFIEGWLCGFFFSFVRNKHEGWLKYQGVSSSQSCSLSGLCICLLVA